MVGSPGAPRERGCCVTSNTLYCSPGGLEGPTSTSHKGHPRGRAYQSSLGGPGRARHPDREGYRIARHPSGSGSRYTTPFHTAETYSTRLEEKEKRQVHDAIREPLDLFAGHNKNGLCPKPRPTQRAQPLSPLAACLGGLSGLSS